jgi:AraC family transcriptional regulator
MLKSNENEYYCRINRVLTYIGEHLDSNLSLAELSELSFFSPFHFHRIFRALVGESVGAYQRRIRLEKAQFFLKYNPSKSITEIAISLGFGSSSAFSRAFKAYYNCTPKSVRENGCCKSPIIHASTSPINRPDSIKKIEILQREDIRVYYRRYSGSYSDGAVLQEWCTHIQQARARGYLSPVSCFYGIVYDDPEVTKDTKCRYDCCISVDSTVTENVKHLPGGLYAVFDIRNGDIENTPDFYRWIYGRWLASSGYEPCNSECYNDYCFFKPGKITSRGSTSYRICLPIQKSMRIA